MKPTLKTKVPALALALSFANQNINAMETSYTSEESSSSIATENETQKSNQPLVVRPLIKLDINDYDFLKDYIPNKNQQCCFADLKTNAYVNISGKNYNFKKGKIIFTSMLSSSTENTTNPSDVLPNTYEGRIFDIQSLEADLIEEFLYINYTYKDASLFRRGYQYYFTVMTDLNRQHINEIKETLGLSTQETIIEVTTITQDFTPQNFWISTALNQSQIDQANASANSYETSTLYPQGHSYATHTLNSPYVNPHTTTYVPNHQPLNPYATNYPEVNSYANQNLANYGQNWYNNTYQAPNSQFGGQQ